GAERRLAGVREPRLEPLAVDRRQARPRVAAHRFEGRHARCRCSGRVRKGAPVAAATALAIAAAPAMTGASPMPLAPSGPSGAGTSTAVVSIRPTYSARGAQYPRKGAA